MMMTSREVKKQYVDQVLALVATGNETQANACLIVAEHHGLRVQAVAAYVAWWTMHQPDYASPRQIMLAVACTCGAGAGVTCFPFSSRIHRSRRRAYDLQVKMQTSLLNVRRASIRAGKSPWQGLSVERAT